MWERGVSDAVGGHDLSMAPNVDGEVACGIAGFSRGRSTAAPTWARVASGPSAAACAYELGSAVRTAPQRHAT